MTGFQSPEMVTDLYRDLRDRRLLPLIVVLLAGLAVVPIALTSKAKTAPALPPAAPVAKTSNAPATPVAVSNPGLRDYRKRLKHDLPKDPFVQQYATPPTGDQLSASGTNISPKGGSGTSSSTTAGVSGSTTSGTSTSTSTSAGGSTSQSTAPPTATTQSKYFFYRVKVKAGPVDGKMKVHDNVKAVTSLPDNQVPALAFLGVQTDSNFGAQKAVFIVNSSVSLVSGNGECSLTGTQCQLLTLSPGDHADLTWSDGVTYRVTLVKFDLISRNGKPNSGGGTGRKADSQQRVSGWNGPSGQHFSF